MEEALTSYLLADAQVSAACGQRVYWVLRPQGSATPCLVLNVISDLPEYVMSGADGLSQTRVQVDAYGATYAAAKTAMRAAKNRLSGATFTQSGVTFQGAFVDGERDSFEAGSNTADRFFRVSVDFILWHR